MDDLNRLGLSSQVFAFRYEHDGELTQEAGTLWAAVRKASLIKRIPGLALVEELPEGIAQNKEYGYFIAERSESGLWQRIVQASFVVLFNRSA